MKLYNTITKRIETFTPRSPDIVQMFVCGPTVYDDSHIGHAKTYVQMDLLARVLKATFKQVYYLQNITDIDNKIIDRARQKKISWWRLAEDYQAKYEADMKALNNISVSTYARATDYIDQIISQVQRLLDSGHAYVIDGDGIYFEISTFKDYGKLSGRTETKENDARSRIDEADGKKGWNDFALWKFKKSDEPSWQAKFTIDDKVVDAEGRPGWHIEDTAITEHFFGPQYDLHGGAIDLIFPHHEAEITQMESISGKIPMVREWTHTGFLTVEGQKMSKSLGNFITIRELIDNGIDPMAIRLLMLQTHYRSELNYTDSAIDMATNRLTKWRSIAALRHQIHDTVIRDEDKAKKLSEFNAAFLDALRDDLNVSEAFKIIEEVFSSLTNIDKINHTEFVGFLETIDDILGLKLIDSTPDIDEDIKRLILERERARENKDYVASDELRDEILQSGIIIRDSTNGPIWEYA